MNIPVDVMLQKLIDEKNLYVIFPSPIGRVQPENLAQFYYYANQAEKLWNIYIKARKL